MGEITLIEVEQIDCESNLVRSRENSLFSLAADSFILKTDSDGFLHNLVDMDKSTLSLPKFEIERSGADQVTISRPLLIIQMNSQAELFNSDFSQVTGGFLIAQESTITVKNYTFSDLV